MADRELTIDAELEAWLPGVPQQTDDELAESLSRSGGPIDSIIVWKGKDIIVDGHRRYRMCQKLKLPYTVREREFLNKDDVKAWMIKEQLARRNVAPDDIVMAERTAWLLKHEQARSRSKGEATDRVATTIGKDKRTVYRHKNVAEALDKLPEPVRNRIRSGQLEPTHTEVLALAELPEMHVNRLMRELDAGAHDCLGDALFGKGHKKPKKDAPLDLEALEEAPEPPPQPKRDTVSKNDDRDPKEFFRRAFAALGRFKGEILHHQDWAVGIANKILAKIDHIDSHLNDWRDNGDEE
jgi:ParB-like chromosome segregation protein Spo0J